MSEQDVTLDLNALAPAKGEITYNDRKITVDPIGLPQYAKLTALSQEMVKLGDDAEVEATLAIYAKIKDLIDECIPQLKEVNLGLGQIMAIFTMLGKMGAPHDSAIAELEKRGIKLNDDNGPKDLASPQQ